ncbi:probable RNA polymerase II nuclear localization protein SLC7A6OS [Bacillus rossius redtenbacheri]|uniref:probable RNA polymerase II nuclear localization protein SLC7A6OS n=1 Tax=Bacillus rossius redtenbacheri TaxID=93214 RepID=UPI002FDCFB02
MAIVRLKRRISDEPVEALLLSCKRKCLEPGEALTEDNPFSTVVQFAGTVTTQDEDVVRQVSKKLREAPKTAFSHVPDLRSKLRDDVRTASQENRFKVVNCFRAIDIDDVASNGTGGEASGSEQMKKPLTIFDIVRNDESLADLTKHFEDKAKEEGFAYDLYYVDLNDMLLENSVELEVYQKDMFFPRDKNINSDTDDASEDSNAESNWRNEYPDTEDSCSVDEDDMRAAVRMENNYSADLSSDDEHLLTMSGLKLDASDVHQYGISQAYSKALHKHDHSYAWTAEASDDDEYSNGSDSNDSMNEEYSD